MRKPIFLCLLAALSLFSSAGFAHHSFQVHFVPDKIITVSGIVSKFTFTNPHGVVYFNVVGEEGEKIAWKAETNSPNMLRRRGWSKEVLAVGNMVTVQGYAARDGSPSMRLNRVELADGTVLTPGGIID